MAALPRGLFDILSQPRPEVGPPRGYISGLPVSDAGANAPARPPVGRYGSLPERLLAEQRFRSSPPVTPGLWIEGSSGGEVAPHESIGIGDPNGIYSTYSFGLPSDAPYDSHDGHVYEDTVTGGQIYDYYAVPEDVLLEIQAGLAGEVDKPGEYNLFTNNCRHYSNEQLEYLINKYNLKPARPPARTPAPPGEWPIPGGSFLDPFVASSSPGPKRRR